MCRGTCKFKLIVQAPDDMPMTHDSVFSQLCLPVYLVQTAESGRQLPHVLTLAFVVLVWHVPSFPAIREP
jgi:hypothetical protein